MKRIFDFLFSTILFIVLLPFLFCIGCLIRLKLGAPIIFTQIRAGKGDQPFLLYKFRTMTNETDKEGKLLSDEERLTRFGKILRRFSIDEIPQLINVIKGDMSLVGPRPLLMEYVPLYSDYHRKRHLLKPGITGWAQINGRNSIKWEEKFNYDVWYVEHRTFYLDMKILWLTFIGLFRSEDINQKGSATMKDFEGYS